MVGVGLLERRQDDLDIPVTTHSYGDEGIQRPLEGRSAASKHGNLASNEGQSDYCRREVFMMPTPIHHNVRRPSRRSDALWAALPETLAPQDAENTRCLIGRSRAPGRQRRSDRVRTEAGSFPTKNNGVEFPMMVSTGHKPRLRALRAATQRGAENCCISDDLGVICEGKIGRSDRHAAILRRHESM